MTIIQILLAIFLIVVIGLVAFWLIKKFLPPEWHRISLAVVGILLLVFLFVYFFPGAGEFRVWR